MQRSCAYFSITSTFSDQGKKEQTREGNIDMLLNVNGEDMPPQEQ